MEHFLLRRITDEVSSVIPQSPQISRYWPTILSEFMPDCVSFSHIFLRKTVSSFISCDKTVHEEDRRSEYISLSEDHLSVRWLSCLFSREPSWKKREYKRRVTWDTRRCQKNTHETVQSLGRTLYGLSFESTSITVSVQEIKNWSACKMRGRMRVKLKWTNPSSLDSLPQHLEFLCHDCMLLLWSLVSLVDSLPCYFAMNLSFIPDDLFWRWINRLESRPRILSQSIRNHRQWHYRHSVECVFFLDNTVNTAMVLIVAKS